MADNLQRVGIELVAEDGGFIKNAKEAQKVLDKLTQGFKDAALQGTKFEQEYGELGSESRKVSTELKKASTSVSELAASTSRGTGTLSKYTNKQKDLQASIKLTEALIEKMRLEYARMNGELGKDSTGQVAAEMDVLAAKIQKAEAELNEYNDQLRQHESRLDDIVSGTKETNLVMRAQQNVLDALNQEYDRDIILRDKYINKLEQQALESERLVNAIKEEKIQIARLSQESAENEAILQQRVVTLRKLEQALRQSQLQEKAYADSVNKLSDTSVIALQRQKDAFRAIEEQGQGIRDIGFTIQDAGIALTAFTTIPFAAGMAASTAAAIEFESSFTGILKTVDGAVQAGTLAELTEQGEMLRQAMLDLALQIPATTSELNLVGERAGQLGVAAEDIAEFTRVVVEFGEATDVTSEDASKAFAQVFNVFKDNLDEQDIVKFADAASNAIVDLGNNFATTESEILHFFQTFAGGAAAFDVVAEDALAIATAFKSVRAQTASSATGIQKTFLNMATAVNEGNENLYRFAEVSGLTAEEFAQQWESRPAVAFQKFLAGLSEAGGAAPNILKQLGLGDVRIQREFLKAAGGADVLAEALEISAAAFGNFGAQGARAEEAARRFATTESQLKLLANEFTNLAIVIGDAFLPAIKDLVKDLRPMIEAVAEFVKLNPGIVKSAAALGGLVATIGPLTAVIGRFVATIGGFKAGIGSLNLGVAALKLAGEKSDDALDAAIANSKTLTGTFRTLASALGTTTAQLLLAFGGITIALAAVAAAAIYVGKEVNEANDRISEMVTQTDAAVKSLEGLSDRQVELLNTIVQASDSFEDYNKAIKVAGFNTGELTEAQYNLIKANGEAANGLDVMTEVLRAYSRELNEANKLSKIFSDFEAPTLDAIGIVDEQTEGVEAYSAAIQELREINKEGDILSDVFFEADVINQIFGDLTSRTSDLSVVTEELLKIYETEAGVLNAIAFGYENGLEIQQEYLRGNISLEEAVAQTIATNEELEVGLAATVNAVQALTGELSTAELEVVAFGRSIGESDEAIIRSIQTQRLMQRAAQETAQAYAELQTGVEGVKTLSEALANAGAFGGAVEEIFSDGSEDAISSIAALQGAWEDFQAILEGTTDGNVADTLVDITNATQDLKDSFAETAIEAERARLEALEYTQVEIEEHIADYSEALGLMTSAQREATLEMIRMREETQLLITGFADANFTVEQQAAALELLAGGYVTTADDAFKLVQADERIVAGALAAGKAVREQAAALEVASASALEAAQSFIAAADAQNKVVESGASGIRKLFDNTSTGASTAASSVEKSVDDMSKSYVGFIETVQDGEKPIENWSKVLLDSAVTAGASLEQIVALTIATGELSDEQAKGLLNQVAAIKAVEGIADAYVKGQITADEAAAAVKGMQEQIESGGEIDLSQYGVYLNELDNVAEGASGAASKVADAETTLRQSVIDMVSSFEELSDAEIRELEVQFGLISVDQADAENKYQNALEAMRYAFGTTFVDGLPVNFGLDVLGIDNFEQYYQELYELAQAGADAAGAIELVVGVSTDLGLDELDAKAFYDEVTAGLLADPEKAAIEVTAEVIVEQGLDEDLLGGNLATLAAQGVEITATARDDGLAEYLDGVIEKTDTLAGEEVVHNAIFSTNIQEEGGPASEVIALEGLIQSVAAEGVEWHVKVNDDDIFNAGQEAQELYDTLFTLDGFVAEVTVRVNTEGTIPDVASGTTGEGGPQTNYHGGLLRGKIGRDKFLSWVSHGEYIMPNYITRKPGVLAALEKMKSSGGAWTPTMGQQRLIANTGNGVTTNNVDSSSRVSNKKNVTINIENGGRGYRNKMLAFANLRRI